MTTPTNLLAIEEKLKEAAILQSLRKEKQYKNNHATQDNNDVFRR